jgi:hypothetical protein
MSSEEKMIDTATGASPPQIRTRDVGSSPVYFESFVQPTSGSGENVNRSQVLLNQERQKRKENIVMNKYVLFIIFNSFVKSNKIIVKKILLLNNSHLTKDYSNELI